MEWNLIVLSCLYAYVLFFFFELCFKVNSRSIRSVMHEPTGFYQILFVLQWSGVELLF